MARIVKGAKGNVLVSVSPATMETLGEVPLATAEEIKAAVAAADRAFPVWAAFGVERRAAMLLKARDYLMDRLDEVCDLISKENGKPRVEALSSEVFVVADLITHFAGRAKSLLADRSIPLHNPMMKALKSSRLTHVPLGVVTVVTPWNYPFSIPMSGIVFALLAGNTVVFKPASDTALIGLKIHEILTVGGALPQGVLNTVVASGKDVGTTLFEPPVRKIVFTGSTAVGRKINEIAARNFIPTSMELGGKDPMVVCEDADLDVASAGAVWGAFTNCGQVCASVERVYVHRKVHDAFVAKVVERTNALRVGSDKDFDVDLGPLANEDQLKTVEEHVRDALAKGARVAAGGRRPDRPGWFFEPTVLVDATHAMKAVTDETFGPLMPVIPFDTEDEAISMANDSLYGLTASVWTRDRARGEALAGRLQAGTVTINDHVYTYGLCDTPWQGMKESGVGRSHSDAGLMEFVYPKHVNADRSPSFMKRRMWWFPYSRAAYEVQKLAVRAFVSAKALPRLVGAVAARKDYRKALM
jgi:succinate-semialdehyde dehydrogenase/glutarate-semialdehyde dehydrogenase